MRFFYALLFLFLLLVDMITVNAGRKSGFRKRKRGRCREPLGMESGAIPDSALSASSSHTTLEPRYARLRVADDTSGGGAWCPLGLVTADTYTFLQINFPRMTVVTRVETQGRHAGGEGRQFTESYRLEYQRRTNGSWRRYHREGQEILAANTDTYTSVYQELYPPIIATSLRLIPTPTTPKPVCLRTEVYGCDWEDALVAYNVRKPDNYQLTPKRLIHLQDDAYDGSVTENFLANGLGKLVDFENGNSRWNRRSSSYLGWKRTPQETNLQFLFEFNGVRNLTQMALYSVSDMTNKIDAFDSVEVECGYDGSTFLQERLVFHNQQEFSRQNGEASAILVPLTDAVCRWLRVTLEYRRGSEWLLLSEVYFVSEPAVAEFIIPRITTTTTPEPVATIYTEKPMKTKAKEQVKHNTSVSIMVLSDERLPNNKSKNSVSSSSLLVNGAFIQSLKIFLLIISMILFLF